MLTKSELYWYDDIAVRDGGHNLRNYWLVNSTPTPEAHFATFGVDIPRTTIEAATPREVCHKCGLARVRLVEETYTASTPGGRRPKQAQPVDDGFMGATAVVKRADGEEVSPSNWKYGRAFKDSRIIGWSSCDCEEPDYQPGIILDPFAGTGTSLWVAMQLGRRYIGIELSEEYAAMARTKLQKWWDPPTVKAPEVPEGQAVLPLTGPQTGSTGGGDPQSAAEPRRAEQGRLGQ